MNDEQPKKSKVLVVAPDSDVFTKRRVEDILDKIAVVVSNSYEVVKDTYDILDSMNTSYHNHKSMSDFVKGHKSKRRKR